MSETKVLLTAEPHTGESTLLKKVLAEIGRPTHGFVTEEVAERGIRTGFEMVTHEGSRFTLATTKIETPFRVGRYSIHLPALDHITTQMLPIPPERLLYLDEIGQMQLYSAYFIQLAQRFLDAPQPFLGTVSAIYEHPFIEQVKKRSDTEILEVTLENRDALTSELVKRFAPTEII